MIARPTRRILSATAAANLFAAAAATAQLKSPVPAQPADWKPGTPGRAFAMGPAKQTRAFVWGQHREPASGVFRLNAVDNTWGDSPASTDMLNECVARVKVSSDKAEYYIKFTRLRGEGSRRPTMGGVAVNQELFGNTDLGGPGLFPRLRAYVAVWGLANVVKNGKVIGRDRTALAWVGEGAQAADGKWLYDPDRSRASAHLIVFGALGHGTRLLNTPDGFLHFSWPTAKVQVPGYAFDPYSRPMAQTTTPGTPKE